MIFECICIGFIVGARYTTLTVDKCHWIPELTLRGKKSHKHVVSSGETINSNNSIHERN